jgi:outer membrane receptor protein involved in Fe transport
MQNSLLTAILLCLFGFTAQSQKLVGYVTNLKSNPVADAYVFNINKDVHAHTDPSGLFSLENTEPGDSIRVSAFGFNPRIVMVPDAQAAMNITLEPEIFSLDEVVISQSFDAINLLSDIHLETNPVNSAQDLLRLVPGLVIGQHAGGGKAEQIFLRGFDIDHGTDIAITVDGMPVNMVSHAHGQGYADLHFLIPETMERVKFGKGPYYADQGNLATAGFVSFRTKERLDQNLLQFEKGQFESQRMLGMFSLNQTERNAAYIATEYQQTNGPFESPQHFSRFNVMGKNTSFLTNGDKVGITASYFTSTWDASGQIPQRAVEDGSISRFGAIDDTEGGQTSRTNLQLEYHKTTGQDALLKNRFYFSDYRFELYSNFTFFLNDTIHGDQIRQREQRQLFGLQSEYNHALQWGASEILLQGSLGFRNDMSHDNELSHTVNRAETIERIQFGDIQETNFYGYLNAKCDNEKWSFNAGMRLDHFDFRYVDQLSPVYVHLTDQKAIMSPKFNIVFQPVKHFQLYAQWGRGFHSNDTRGVVVSEGLPVLPAATGVDLGVMWKPIPELVLQTAVWNLYLEQEFVYVGDAGIVEPGWPSRRDGIDLSIRYQPWTWIYADVDLNVTRARSLDAPEGEDFIPLAPGFTAMGGFHVISPSGVFGGLRVRHLDDRPANEDNSIIATGYTVVDANIGYTWKKLEFNLQVQNLFNTEWNETQFATESRLKHEPAPVEEIHYTPGTPFFLKGSIGYRF